MSNKVMIGLMAVMVVVLGVIWYVHWHIRQDVVWADVCAKVVHIHEDDYIHLKIVRGYNEYWDQQVGVVFLAWNENQDLVEDDRLTMTARDQWGDWSIDWDTPYENCPEAFSGSGG